MSGGSYNYLYSNTEDIVPYGIDGDLKRMADDAAADGYEEFAGELMDFALEIRRVRNRLNTYNKRLSEKMRAYEWWKSYDSSQDQFEKTLIEEDMNG